jgi:hypothetical protein
VIVVLTGCQLGKRSDQVPPLAELVAANRALTAHLPQPRLRWRLPGVWSHQSIFDAEPDGPVLLALSYVGDKLEVVALDWATGTIRWRSPLPYREPPALTAAAGLALAHDSNYNIAAFDLRTGRAMWNRKLDCEIATGRLGASGDGPLLALCERAQRGWVLALDPATGATRWTHKTADYLRDLYADERKAYFPQPFVDGEAPRREKPDSPIFTGPGVRWEWLVVDASTGSIEDTLIVPKIPPDAATGTKWLSAFSRKDAHSLWDVTPFRAFQLYRFEEDRPCPHHGPNSGYFPDDLHHGRHVVRSGRWFDIRCDRVVERDAHGVEARSYPIPRIDDLSGSSVAAIDLVGDDLVLWLPSYHDALPGRIVIVHPDGQHQVLLAPGLDEHGVAMHKGILVVQQGADLAAYSLLDSRSGSLAASGLEQVRDLVRGRGQVDHRACATWKISFDDLATVPLTRIPGWEHHLAVLFFNPDPKTRDSALAAAVHLKSRYVARVLTSVLATEDTILNIPRPPQAPHSRFHFYAKDDTSLRSLAVMALVAMSYSDAAPALAKHAQRSPGFDNSSRCSSDTAAICDFLNHSASPQARQAIASYDTAIGAEGAFKALCERRLY